MNAPSTSIVNVTAMLVTVVMTVAGLCALPANAQAVRSDEAPDISRGRLLYETNCGGCHESHLHMRSEPKARTYAEIRRFVEHWSDVARTGWNAEDFTDVTAWLNDEFYLYPCADMLCALPSTIPDRASR